MSKTIWQIEVFNLETKKWRAFGSPSSYFNFAYAGMKKLEQVGYKVRLRKVVVE